MAYDATRGVTVLFGGYSGFAPLYDTWEYVDSEWREVNLTVSPPADHELQMVYDSRLEVCVLYETAERSTWHWDGAVWSALNGPAGIGTENGLVLAFAVLDDGSGPALYTGGTFDTAGGITVNYVARWDGTTWSALTAPGGTGVDSGVGALAVFDDGSGDRLFAGGGFTHAGGLRVNHIARWDGQDWSPLAGPFGTGMSVPRGGVSAFGVFDDGQGPALFAGGAFGTAGGLYSENVGVWRCLPDIFADGFETGTTLAWWETVPNP